MISEALHDQAVLAVLVAAPLAAIALVFISAPYGRHGRSGWGPQVPGRVGWIVMESPAVLLFAAVFFLGAASMQAVPLLLLALWMFHYVHRTFVFPFRLASTRPMPVVVAAMAFVFQVLNAYANAAWIGGLGDYSGWITDPRLWIGVALFVVGEAINLHADTVLINLRKPGETGYQIPKGGMYHYLTCPNYFGEIVAWAGWAMATWSWAGLAFLIFTMANLVPRALTNHAWYHEKFPDYPAERRAVIPFVL